MFYAATHNPLAYTCMSLFNNLYILFWSMMTEDEMNLYIKPMILLKHLPMVESYIFILTSSST